VSNSAAAVPPTLHQRGFEVVAGIIAPHECDRLIACLPNVEVGTRSLLGQTVFSELAYRLRRETVLAHRLQHLVAVQATLFTKSFARNWSLRKHCDTVLPIAGDGPWIAAGEKEGQTFVHAPIELLRRCVAVRLSLDEVPEGDLEVVPDSHGDSHRTRDCAAPVRVVVPRGGALLLRPSTIHGSAKLVESKGRRVEGCCMFSMRRPCCPNTSGGTTPSERAGRGARPPRLAHSRQG
jgi:hypothetical protein